MTAMNIFWEWRGWIKKPMRQIHMEIHRNAGLFKTKIYVHRFRINPEFISQRLS